MRLNFKLFDLYSDYLLSSFSATTATGMSALMDKAISHDQISDAQRPTTGAGRLVADRQTVCAKKEGVITASIVGATDENELICWHYDHAQAGMVKGINFITALYTVGEVSLPVTYRLVSKTESYIDKRKRRSRDQESSIFAAKNCCITGFPAAMCLMTSWFAC